MRETLDGFQGGLQIGGSMITNLCYADDVILLATSEAELQELVDCLNRVSHRYGLLININKTKVMASDGIPCRILIQNEQLVQLNTSRWQVAAARAWNALPQHVRNASSLPVFRRELKTVLFRSSFPDAI